MTCAGASPTSWSVFDFAVKQQKIARLEEQSAVPDFWDDSEAAQRTLKELAGLRDEITPWIDLDKRISDTEVLLELAEEADDADTLTEVQAELTAIEAKLADLEFKLVLSGPYDR